MFVGELGRWRQAAGRGHHVVSGRLSDSESGSALNLFSPSSCIRIRIQNKTKIVIFIIKKFQNKIIELFLYFFYTMGRKKCFVHSTYKIGKNETKINKLTFKRHKFVEMLEKY